MNEQPSECNNCGYETEQLEYFNHSDKWLCEICSSTHLANKNLNKENTLLAKSIAYLGNMILDEIKIARLQMMCPYCKLSLNICQCQRV